MPPRPKCTREEVAMTALAIVKEDGLDALTARELGKRLGTSVSPVFTLFSSMDEVKLAARELALREFKEYVSDYKEYTPAFKRIGMMLVSYGMHEPELFKLLFMQEHKERQSFAASLGDLDDIGDVCMELLQRDYGMTQEEARLILEQMWTNAYGLGVMCAMGVCNLEEEEIGRRLGIMFAGLTILLKSGKLEEVYGDVERNSAGTYHGIPVGNLPYAAENAEGEKKLKISKEKQEK